MNNEFYLKKFKKILWDGFFDCLKRNNAFLAGGAILSIVTKKEINDLDIYFKSLEDAKNFYEDIQEESYYCINETNRSLILVDKNKHNKRPNINMIIFDWFQTPEEIFNLFDFSICQSAFDGDKFYFSDRYFIDVASRALHYNPNTRYPISSLLRLKKYQEKGYKISRNQFLKMCLNIQKKKIETYEELESEIGGVYGIDLDVIMPELKENFSIEKFINGLDEIDFEFDNKDITSKVKDIGYPQIFKQEYPVLEIRDKFISTLDFKECKETDNKVQYPIFVYKWVKDDLTSFYDKSVRYEIGKILEDKKEHGFNILYDKDEHHFYSSKKNAVKIKLMVLSKDDIYYHGNEMVVSKCIPIEIVEKNNDLKAPKKKQNLPTNIAHYPDPFENDDDY